MGKRLIDEHFPGIGEIRAVRQARKHSLDSRKVAYRRAGVYTKSLVRWRKERERRRRVRVLVLRGWSLKRVAVELGVSTRTVMRDWKKIQSYVKGQINKEYRQAAERRRRELEQKYPGLVSEDAKLAEAEVNALFRLSGERGSRVRPEMDYGVGQQPQELIMTVDLDNTLDGGFPFVEVHPDKSIAWFQGEFSVKLFARKNGETRELRSFRFRV